LLHLKKLVGILLNFIGWGIVLHAIASELYLKGGYSEILMIQGEYIGLALNLIGTLILIFPGKAESKIKSLGKKVWKYRRAITATLLFMGGSWQLDILVAPALWHLEQYIENFNEPFLLPFNIPIHKQIAYCLFFSMVGAGFILAIFNGEYRNLFKEKIVKLFKR